MSEIRLKSTKWILWKPFMPSPVTTILRILDHFLNILDFMEQLVNDDIKGIGWWYLLVAMVIFVGKWCVSIPSLWKTILESRSIPRDDKSLHDHFIIFFVECDEVIHDGPIGRVQYSIARNVHCHRQCRIHSQIPIPLFMSRGTATQNRNASHQYRVKETFPCGQVTWWHKTETGGHRNRPIRGSSRRIVGGDLVEIAVGRIKKTKLS